MEIGDVVRYKQSRWKVISFSPGLRVYVLANDQNKVEAPDDAEALEDLKVLFNPGRDWPFVAIPLQVKGGPLVKVLRSGTELEFMVDWVPSDFVKPRAVFFSPGLNLRRGEVLSGVHKSSDIRSRISISPTFGSGQVRKHRNLNPQKVPGPKTALDRLVAPSLFDDDD